MTTEGRPDHSRNVPDLAKLAHDAAYVAVGFGVVGLQRAQVARREMLRGLERQSQGSPTDVKTHIASVASEIDKAATTVLTTAGRTIRPLATRLAPDARRLVDTALEAADQFRRTRGRPLP